MKTPDQRHPHLVAIEMFEDALKEAFKDSGGTYVRPRPDLLHIVEPEGDTYITALPIPAQPGVDDDATATCMLNVISLLRTRPRLTDEQINECNRYAGMSHMARSNDAQQQVMAANAFTITSDEAQRARSLYVALQAAVLQRTWLSQVLSGLENNFARQVEVLDPYSAGRPSAWSNDEISELYQLLSDGGYPVAYDGPTGFLANLNKTKVKGQSSFLIVRNDMPHPFYGNGLSVVLVRPNEPGVSMQDLHKRAIAWNMRDVITITQAPCIGGWSVMADKHQLQHTIFVPNVIYAPGMGQLVLEAAITRWVSGDEPATPI